jgi:hypothetical protein
MLKTTTAVMVAATIATAVTVLSAPPTRVDASPLTKTAAAPMIACAQRAWPYLRCVGTELGSPHVRLVSTDRLN